MWKPRSSPRLNSSCSASRPAAGGGWGRPSRQERWVGGLRSRQAGGPAGGTGAGQRAGQQAPHSPAAALAAPALTGDGLDRRLLASSPSSIVSNAGSTMPCRRVGAGSWGSHWSAGLPVRDLWDAWSRPGHPSPQQHSRVTPTRRATPRRTTSHLAEASDAAQLLVLGWVVDEISQLAVGQEVGVQQ